MGCLGSAIEIPILNNMNGSVHAGELNAIMGPTSSGKITLLNMLSTCIPHSSSKHLVGQVLTNSDNKVTPARLKQPRYCIFFPEIHGQETVHMAAMLKLLHKMLAANCMHTPHHSSQLYLLLCFAGVVLVSSTHTIKDRRMVCQLLIDSYAANPTMDNGHKKQPLLIADDDDDHQEEKSTTTKNNTGQWGEEAPSSSANWQSSPIPRSLSWLSLPSFKSLSLANHTAFLFYSAMYWIMELMFMTMLACTCSCNISFSLCGLG